MKLTVRVININYDESSKIFNKSKTLKEYSYFVHMVNQNKENGMEIDEAIKKAMKQCIEEEVLKEFFKLHGSEVLSMLFTEFNLDDSKEVWREEGIEKGREERNIEIAISLLGLLDDEIIAEKTGLTLKEIEGLKNAN